MNATEEHFDRWYTESPAFLPDGSRPAISDIGLEAVMRHRTQAHQWITFLRTAAAQTICLQASIEEFRWAQGVLTIPNS